MVLHSFSFLQIHLSVKFPGTLGYSKLVALGSRGSGAARHQPLSWACSESRLLCFFVPIRLPKDRCCP